MDRVSTLSSRLSAELIDICPEALAAVDTSFRVVAWNKAAERLFGWTAGEVIGGPLPMLTPDERVALVRQIADAGGEPTHTPAMYTRHHRDGTPVPIVVTRQIADRAADGTILGYASYFRRATPDDVRLHHRNAYSQLLAEAARRDEVVAALRDALGDLLPGERAFVLLADTGGGYRGVLAAGANTEVGEQIRVAAGGPAAAAIALGRGEHGELPLPEGPAPALFVPMGPRSGGCVLALTGDGVSLADDDDVELAIALAGEAWATLRRVDLVHELEEKVEILEAIAAIAATTRLEMPEMLATIAESSARLLSCERGAVYLRDETGALRLAAFHAADLEAEPGEEAHRAGERAAADMLAQVTPFLAQDASQCGWLDGPWDPRTGAVSVYALPLRMLDGDLGAIVVAHTTANPRGFTNLCQQVGSALAQQAALAVGNARLLATQQDAVQRLQELDRIKADYVTGIVHDLRTPVTSLIGFARTLARDDLGLRPDEHREFVESIERQATRLGRMLDDLVDTARADAGALVPDKLDDLEVAGLVLDAVHVLSPDGRVRVRADIPAGLRLRGDASQLTRVLQNLLDNAVRYAPAPSPVEVHAARVGDDVAITVTDHGPGLDEEARTRLFTRFGRGAGGQTGLGLYTAHGIVAAHGGAMEVGRTPGGGCTFTVTLPQ